MQKRLFGILTTAAIIVAACGGATTSTAPSGAPSTAPSADASAEPSAAGDQTITMAMDGDVSGGLGNAADNVPTAEAAQFLYNGLYEYDESLTPVPALAAELATISADGLTWTIPLKSDIKFHDGTDMTAEDVVQTYQIAQSPNCRYNPSICLATFLDKVEAVDESTVAFTLKQQLSTFATIYLPAILIESKDAIDASYAKYVEGAGAVTAAETKAFLDLVAAEEAAPTGPADDAGAPTVNYAQFIADAEALLTKAGSELPDKAIYTADGVLDEATYAQELITRIKAIDATFTASAIDALAAAYPYLDFQRNPVGTGPFKFVEFRPGESLEYAANEEYHLGAPAIKQMFIPIIKDDIAGGQALAAGEVDWKYSLTGPTYEEIKCGPGPEVRGVPGLRLLRPVLQPASGRERAVRRPEPPSGGLVLLRQGGHRHRRHQWPGCRHLQRDPAGVVGLSHHGPEHVPDGPGEVEGAHRGFRLDPWLRRRSTRRPARSCPPSWPCAPSARTAASGCSWSVTRSASAGSTSSSRRSTSLRS